MLDLLIVTHVQIVIVLIQFKNVISVKCQQCEIGSACLCSKYHSHVEMNCTKNNECLLHFYCIINKYIIQKCMYNVLKCIYTVYTVQIYPRVSYVL